MSWNIDTITVEKAHAAEVIGQRAPNDPVDAAVMEQIVAARAAALVLLQTVPGPKVRINISGHANGVGEQEKPGYANDYISVVVTQVTRGSGNYGTQGT